jgi:hypothetical protein
MEELAKARETGPKYPAEAELSRAQALQQGQKSTSPTEQTAGEHEDQRLLEGRSLLVAVRSPKS